VGEQTEAGGVGKDEDHGGEELTADDEEWLGAQRPEADGQPCSDHALGSQSSYQNPSTVEPVGQAACVESNQEIRGHRHHAEGGDGDRLVRALIDEDGQDALRGDAPHLIDRVGAQPSSEGRYLPCVHEQILVLTTPRPYPLASREQLARPRTVRELGPGRRFFLETGSNSRLRLGRRPVAAGERVAQGRGQGRR
jgi:hypothetical protein